MKKLILLVSLFTSASLQAQQAFQPNWYGGVGAGWTRAKDESSDLAKSLVQTVGGTATVTQSSSNVFQGRIFGGLQISPGISLELGYIKQSAVDFNVAGVAGSLYGYRPYAATISSNFSGLDYSLLWYLDDSFFRLGGHSTKRTDEFNNAFSTLTETTSGTGLILGLGFDEDIGENSRLRAEFTRLNNLAGISESYANVWSLSFLGKF